MPLLRDDMLKSQDAIDRRGNSDATDLMAGDHPKEAYRSRDKKFSLHLAGRQSKIPTSEDDVKVDRFKNRISEDADPVLFSEPIIECFAWDSKTGQEVVSEPQRKRRANSEERAETSLMRSIRACSNCRMAKTKCTITHHDFKDHDLSDTFSGTSSKTDSLGIVRGFGNTSPNDRLNHEFTWTARSFSTTNTKRSVLGIEQEHCLKNASLVSTPSSLAVEVGIDPEDEEKSVPNLNIAFYDVPINSIERPAQVTTPSPPIADAPKTPRSDVEVLTESNDMAPFASEGYGLDQSSNPSEPRSVSDESATDGDSKDLQFWLSDYSEGTPQLDDEHPLLHLHRKTAVSHLLSKFYAQCQERMPRQSGSDTANSKSAANPPTICQSDRQIGQKRERCSVEEQQATKDDLGGVQKKRRISKSEKKRPLLLACPFSKKDPLHYRACYKQTLTKISYVKQHLSRNHRTPIYCPVCMGVFENEGDRDAHTRLRACEERPLAHWEGVSEVQKRQLQKKVPAKMSEEEQWFTIWDIVFPGVPRPRSSYVDSDLSEELSAFRDFAIGHGPAIMRDHLRTAGYTLDTVDQSPELTAFLETVIADILQLIFEKYVGAGQRESQRRSTFDSCEPSQARTDSSTISLVEDQIAIGTAPATRTDRLASGRVQNLEELGGGHISEPFDQILVTDPADNVTNMLEHLPQDQISVAPTSLLFPELGISGSLGNNLFQTFLDEGLFSSSG